MITLLSRHGIVSTKRQCMHSGRFMCTQRTMFRSIDWVLPSSVAPALGCTALHVQRFLYTNIYTSREQKRKKNRKKSEFLGSCSDWYLMCTKYYTLSSMRRLNVSVEFYVSFNRAVTGKNDDISINSYLALCNFQVRKLTVEGRRRRTVIYVVRVDGQAKMQP